MTDTDEKLRDSLTDQRKEDARSISGDLVTCRPDETEGKVLNVARFNRRASRIWATMDWLWRSRGLSKTFPYSVGALIEVCEQPGQGRGRS